MPVLEDSDKEEPQQARPPHKCKFEWPDLPLVDLEEMADTPDAALQLFKRLFFVIDNPPLLNDSDSEFKELPRGKSLVPAKLFSKVFKHYLSKQPKTHAQAPEVNFEQIQNLVDTTTHDLIEKNQDQLYSRIVAGIESRFNEIEEMRSDLKTQTKKMLATK